jgi:hypothetical protein
MVIINSRYSDLYKFNKSVKYMQVFFTQKSMIRSLSIQTKRAAIMAALFYDR